MKKIIEHGYTHYVFPPEELDYVARELSDEVYRPVMEITVKAGLELKAQPRKQNFHIQPPK